MIKSILDSDAYKFSMQAAVLQLYPKAEVRYEFINRGNHKFTARFAEELMEMVNAMSELRLTVGEKEWMQNNMQYLSPAYLDFLSGYRFDPKQVSLLVDSNGSLRVRIEGPWFSTILWETPIMATISELYFVHEEKETREKRRKKNETKGKVLADVGVVYADFGTRRRVSYNNHIWVVEDLINSSGNSFIGTSNPFIAMQKGIKTIGTQAHEFFQFHGAIFGYRMANQLSLERWVDVFQGDLGIALSDTFTTDVFLEAFGKKYAKLFDGTRHDSSCPIKFMNKMITHYKNLGIDPKTKTIVFSDSLNVDKVIEIENYRADRVKAAYGIGTNLTNDVGVKPLNMVIKMTACKMHGGRWINTVKLSDDVGKHTGDKDEIDLCKKMLGIKI